jgi:hypothetical protein
MILKLTQGIKKEKDLLDRLDEVVKIKPGLFGISINVNALLKKWRKRKA